MEIDYQLILFCGELKVVDMLMENIPTDPYSGINA